MTAHGVSAASPSSAVASVSRLAAQLQQALPQVQVLAPSFEDAVPALARDVARRLQAGLDQRGQAVLAVSGGKSPIPFFEALRVQPLDWSRVLLSLVDERCVANTHADSNVRLVRQHLQQDAAAAARLVPLVDQPAAPLPPLAELVRLANVAQAALPVADVLVLGMGPDGHTASLFPQTPELAQGLDLHNPAPCLGVSVPPTAPNAPYERVSLTLRQILRARHLVLPLQGQDKFQVLGQALAGPDPAWPISHVLHAPGASLALWLQESPR